MNKVLDAFSKYFVSDVFKTNLVHYYNMFVNNIPDNIETRGPIIITCL